MQKIRRGRKRHLTDVIIGKTITLCLIVFLCAFRPVSIVLAKGTSMSGSSNNLGCEMDSSLVLAEYHVWHGLSSHHQPPPYISIDPAVISAHIRVAQEQCIDGFVVNWYGPPNGLVNDEDRAFMDQAIAELIRQAEKYDFYVAIMYDEGTARGTISYMNRVISDLLYAQRYFTMPSYLQINGQPALFIFPYEDVDPVIDWFEVRQQLDVAVTLLDKDPNPEDPIHDAQFDGFYAWVQPTNGQWQPDGSEIGEGYLRGFYSTMASQMYSNKITIGTVWPGFDDALASWGKGRYMSRRCGQTWVDTWNIAKEYDPSFVMIATFNDFEEGTDTQDGIAKLTATNNSPTTIGQETLLTATVADCNRVAYTWEFGDGINGKGAVVSHIYPVPGTYTALATADISGTIVTATTIVTVEDENLTPEIAWQEDFDPIQPSRWMQNQFSAIWEDISGPTARLQENNPDGHFGKVESEIIGIDVDAYPFLGINVTAIDQGASYTVQILDKNSGNSKDVLKNISSPGKHTVNIASELNWQGPQSFTINIWINGEGKSVIFDRISIETYTVFLPIIIL